jgi:hypothetical protein
LAKDNATNRAMAEFYGVPAPIQVDLLAGFPSMVIQASSRTASMLAVAILPRGRITTLSGEATLSRGLSHHRITPVARLGRALAAEHQAESSFEFSSYSCSFVSQPALGLLLGLRRQGLAPLRRSRVSLASYVLARFRSSAHPYSRDSLPVPHHADLPPQTHLGATHDGRTESACRGPSFDTGAAYNPIGIGLQAV